MKQNPDHAVVVVNPFVVYLGLAIAAILLQKILSLPFIPVVPSHYLGGILIALNFGFGIPALLSMLRARTSPNPSRPSTLLLLNGIYRFTRNPMYIGLTFAFAGLSTYFQFTWGLLFIPLVVWLITVWVIIPEEKYLETKFGEEYLQYKSKVRRWI